MKAINTWKIWANRTGRIENKHLPKVKRVIEGMYLGAANIIRSYDINTARNRLMMLAASPTLPDVIREIYRDAGLFGAQWTYSNLSKQVRKMPGQKAANIGRNLSWITEVLNYLKIHLLQFAANITATTRDDILKIIEKGVEEGKGGEEIAREIESSGFPLMRARLIARTEVITGVNLGHKVGAQSLPFEVNKRWSSAKDRRTRHSHVSINGHTVAETEKFKVAIYKGGAIVGHDMMDFPGDPGASAGNRINCRCRLLHIPVRDAQGRPVRRAVKPLLTF